MKRDMDLIRLILLEIEKSDPYQVFRPNLCGYQDKEVSYHLELLISAGLVEGQMHYTGGMTANPVVKLSWVGHDFLDDIRSDSIWKKTKELLKNEGLKTVSFEILKAAVEFTLKRQLGLDG